MNSSTLKTVLLVAVCLGLVELAGCKRQTPAGATPFPASNQVADWARTGEIRTFPAADLWKYIDGEAERYLKAGVQSASTADYRFRDRVDAVVDIYTMRSAEEAEKILTSEPVGDAEAVHLGDSARLYSQSLVFRKGPYLVRITAYAEATELRGALLDLGRFLEQRLTP